MASEVDICNMALASIGANANIVSINPPSGSAAAEHCARFYPLSRDGMLERHSWNFATKVIDLVALDNLNSSWKFAYAIPSDFLSAVSVTSVHYEDPPLGIEYYGWMNRKIEPAGYTYAIELGIHNHTVIVSNLEDARLTYVSRIVDTSRFSPSFISAVQHSLASMIAGVLIKSDVGAKQAKESASLAEHFLNVGRRIDSNQRNIKPLQTQAPWITYR